MQRHLLRMISAAVLLLGVNATGWGEIPGTPEQFSATAEIGYDGKAFVLLEWNLNPNGGLPHFFNIYKANGHVQDLNLFAKLTKVPLKYDSIRNPVTHHTYAVTGLPPGDYSFYLTAVNPDGESAPTPVRHVTIVAHPVIHFTTTPPAVGWTQREYLYDADAKASVPGEIRYRAITLPAGAQLDTITGVLRYSTQSEGKVVFSIGAYLVSDPAIKATQQWHVLFHHDSIPYPHHCALIHGVIRDAQGGIIGYGEVEVKSLANPAGPLYVGKITQGTFSVAVKDSGAYILKASGPEFKTEWYLDADTEQNATPVTVHCGDTIRVVMHVERITYWSISGKVTDAVSGDPLQVKVVVEGEHGIITHVYTDAHGAYTVRLPEGGRYILWTIDPAGRYRTQYYDKVPDRSQATTIELTGDRTGVDFALIKHHQYDNGVHVFVKDSAGSTLHAKVLAYYFKTGSQVPDLKYTAAGYPDSIASGGVVIRNMMPGEYILQALPLDHAFIPGYYREQDYAAHDWQSATRVTVDQTGVAGPFTIVLKRRTGKVGGGILHGTVHWQKSGVRTGESVPVVSATVLIHDDNGDISEYAVSDSDGMYIISGIGTGDHTLVVDRVGYQPYSTTVHVRPGTQSMELSPELQPVVVTSIRDAVPPAHGVSFDVYPNPAFSTVFLRIADPETEGTVILYDRLGRVARRATIDRWSGERSIVMEIGDLQPGTYILHLSVNGKSGSRLLTVMR